MIQRNGQVQLSELLFTQSWEDPATDRKALEIRPGETVVSITSGGCNTLEFLLDDPGRIFSVDINPAQSFLLELKMASMKVLGYSDWMGFLGLRPSGDRWDAFQSLRDELTPGAVQFWSARRSLLENGILGRGRFEQFVAKARALLRFLQGKDRILGLFEPRTPEERKAYFERVWDTGRWRSLFVLCFNKWVLARRGLSADYFRFDDGTRSFSGSFYERTRRVMTQIPVRDNYFLSQYLLGEYYPAENLPEYLRPDHFEVLRRRLNRVTLVTADLKDWLRDKDARTVDCFSLSNICELMSPGDTEYTFQELLRTGRQAARACLRNLMVQRTIPARFQERIRRNALLSDTLLGADRSFVYSRIDAFQFCA
jgi:S-adenosylmethionine-diacylglycerol 3-amino-3-carboxypropyl transferase